MKQDSTETKKLEKRIEVNPDKCTGCRICELTCIFKKEGEFNPRNARIHVLKIEGSGRDIPMVCRQCERPKCLEVCPVKALEKSEDSGAILVDENLCTGCASCVDACPFGAIHLHLAKGVVVKCDLCGGNPECIKRCPTGALKFTLPLQSLRRSS